MQIFKLSFCILLSISISNISCKTEDHSTQFSKLEEGSTKISFKNTLIESEDFNVMNYSYFYNGGGVAIGDINNDGLQDIFFTGNMVKNRLYINRRDFKFEDITQNSHIADLQGWCTGVTMVDINEDGWLDIYICRSADYNSVKRKNLLFINNHDNTFTEKAEQFGLDDDSFSTQASFFDFDKDGDLDMFLLNHSIQKYSGFSKVLPDLKNQKNSAYGNKLYKNDNGKFYEISEKAGIISTKFNFGLGVAISDINNDGWPDIYVTSDFEQQDYLYINNKNGTFSEKIKDQLGHTSLFSMGSDLADYNNDGFTDIITLDMLPESNERIKMTSGADNYDKVHLLPELGFHNQYMRNMLQLNNGNGTFSEIGQLANVSNTDWSWSPLFGDYDNDGYKDLFITNGYLRDYTNMDFLKYTTDAKMKNENLSVTEIIAKMPASDVDNYIFRNKGDLTFEKKTSEWGLSSKNVSNGAAYADLDNDGDLDLVTSNINDFASIYRNNSEKLLNNNYLTVKLSGTKQNPFGVGAKVKTFIKGKVQYQEQIPVRGYQSSVEQKLHFGFSNSTIIDSLLIIWPNDKTQILKRLKTNQIITLKESNAKTTYDYKLKEEKVFFTEVLNTIKYTHKENNFNDFKSQLLLTNMLSRSGPCMAKGDVNNDGLEDLFIGSAKGYVSQLFIQESNGTFTIKNGEMFNQDSLNEDTDALFFDTDGDKDLDLYIVSGGNEFNENDEFLQDRLYINDGKGNFKKNKDNLPKENLSGSCVKASDFDHDGDIDVFVGNRLIPGKYPQSPGSFLLVNNGKGKFSNQTKNIFPDLENIGMVTDAIWVDLNKDSFQDLVIVGDWMPIKFFINNKNKFSDQSKNWLKEVSSGFWNKIIAEDFDKDGDIDFVIGNQGTNSQIKADHEHPATMFYKDFDNNGTLDPIVNYYVGENSFPFASRDDMVEQMPLLKKKFPDYKLYSNASIKDFFSENELKNAKMLKVEKIKTYYLENKNKEFVFKELPIQVQFSQVFTIQSLDINKDGNLDLILAGNLSVTRAKFGSYDASYGQLLLGDGKGNFTYSTQQKSGLKVKGDVRSLQIIKSKLGKDIIVFGVNNSKIITYTFK